MHRVKRAVIMAAGIGKRMWPITLETPKPLVQVNGRRMIDTVIGALHANGITEIYVVVGYLREQFESLEREYPGVELIVNPYYDAYNNIASLYVAREHLEDVMILDGDQIIYNEGVLAPEFEHSGYNAVWTKEWTDEWLMQVKDGVVTQCSRTGGERGWQLFSISRWSAADGRRLRRHLEQEFEEKKNRQIFWDDVALFCHPEDYQLGIWEMLPQDVAEVDSLAELAQLDESYRKYMEEEQGD
ncbi:MAG: phosphocholine cytidylyltransferase family protein [Lachnospiraceae bacterium]|nr:phosphocholine cytidylyltransferase family protein [Lachnospiraceae bacterium]MCI9545838.1 phosphocholine cytidylyltransferase family protein [Lachnospiraceae bacterium]